MIKREGLSLWPLSLPFYYFPACLLHGLPFANFFFYLLCRLIHPSHAWENLNRKMHKIDEEEKGLCLVSNSFFFLFKAVVISVVLLNTFYVYRVLTFVTFYRNLHSAANSPLSQLLVFPYFTQPREKIHCIFQLKI